MSTNFEIGTEVAFDMNCPCGDENCDNGEQGYSLHTIDGTEDEDYLKRCIVFSKETMDKLR